MSPDASTDRRRPVIRVALPVPLRRAFDYEVADGSPIPAIGARVRVPFGARRLTGVVVGRPESPATQAALRPVDAVLDPAPLLPDELYTLLVWAARYYHHPIGEVFATALPGPMREGAAPEEFDPVCWRLIANPGTDATRRAPRQREALAHLDQLGGVASSAALREAGFGSRIVTALCRKGLIERASGPSSATSNASPITLNPEQERACAAVRERLDTFHCVLLDGVTGSGKTEVYLRCIEAVLGRGGQALVLIPEIGLTPQTLGRFAARFGAVEVYHSGLTDHRRAEVWQACRSGRTRVLIGTRSAVFMPFERLGLVAVDEEHDGSFKQQDGFRYSARDLAVKRCQQLSIPLLLGSATPSLESLRNAARDRYQRLRLSARAGSARAPRMRVVDMRGQRARDGLSDELVRALREQVEAGNQALLFINRRGFAPTFMCAGCGWVAACPRCDSRATLHRQPAVLRCHHCGWQQPLPERCPSCTSDGLLPVGTGTQRGETAVQELLPDIDVLRIDRDMSRSPTRLQAQLERIATGRPAVLVGTQMLAKGHHFPAVTLVGIVNADAGLFSADFKAPEHTAQLIVQVAGRAGRADRAGEVWIQTYNPDHPILRVLETEGYAGFAELELETRERAALPPFRAMALLRAESTDPDAARACLADIIRPLATRPDVERWGPVPAPMARRADRYRLQCVLLGERSSLHRGLAACLAHADEKRYPNVRWSLDVDPFDLV